MLNFENLDKAIFPGEGGYGIQKIDPLPAGFRADKLIWIPFF